MFVSPQKSILLKQSAINHESRVTQVTQVMSPIKSMLNNDRSYIKVDLGRKVVNVNELMPTQRIVSPSKFVQQQVHYQPSPREVELERKVKILEMRIGELYSQKNLVETQFNEANIRLQCENTLLKQKVNQLSLKPVMKMQ